VRRVGRPAVGSEAQGQAFLYSVSQMRSGRPGFTLVELLVVIAIVGTLLTIAVPRYFASVERSKEAVLKENLAVMRDALQKYYGDKGKYPEKLDELASGKYLRKIPVDPITASNTTWVAVPPKESSEKGGVYDVHSGAPGNGSDGTPFAEW
jgi:general secretion pathway protein G